MAVWHCGDGTLGMEPALPGSWPGFLRGWRVIRWEWRAWELPARFLRVSLPALPAPCTRCLPAPRGEGDASLPVPTVGSIPPIPSPASPGPAPTGAVITARCALIAPFQLIKPGGDPNYDPLSCQAPYF